MKKFIALIFALILFVIFPAPTRAQTDVYLMETGDAYLLETGDKILLEEGVSVARPARTKMIGGGIY